jgi:ABC-2 type transport system permease protein
MTQSSAEVFDLGYQHYDGPREGRMRARKALWTNGVRTALGLGRSTRAKILPLLLFAAVMAPAVVIVLVASTAEELGARDQLWGHAEYYGLVSILVLIFSAIIAPELLCPDRRDRVLHLYLVRPLTSDDYVAGRWLAFFTITLALVYSGQIVLFVGSVFDAPEPLDYLRDNWLDVPRFLAAGLAVAAFTTTIPLAVSAFTTRRAFAAGFVIGLFIISLATAGALTSCPEHDERVELTDTGNGRQVTVITEECEPVTGDYAKWFGLINLSGAPIYISDWIFDEENEDQPYRAVAELPIGIPIGVYFLLTLGPAAVLVWRYRRIQI